MLVLRTETEKTQAVELGVAKVIGPNTEAIVREIERLLYEHDEYNKMARKLSLYGDGNAAERIVRVLRELSDRQ